MIVFANLQKILKTTTRGVKKNEPPRKNRVTPDSLIPDLSILRNKSIFSYFCEGLLNSKNNIKEE
jgi:hypothetical protein